MTKPLIKINLEAYTHRAKN